MVKRIRKTLAYVLAFAMTVSMFTNYQMPVAAKGEHRTQTVVLDFVPQENETAENTTVIGQTATINGTSVRIYEDLYYGAPGIEVSVEEDTKIELVTAYSFSNGAVLYHFDYKDKENTENAALYDAVLDYMYISASDITIGGGDIEPTPTPEPTVSPEVTPSPEPIVTPDPTTSPDDDNDMSGIKDYGSVNFNAYIIPDALTIYKNHIDDVEYKVVENVAGEEVRVYFFYELENGTVKYKVEYTGENTAISTAIAEGYEFVKSTDVAKVLADSTTGVSVSGSLPEDVSLTVTPAAIEELSLDTTKYLLSENSLFYDVTLSLGGAEYQPENGITVTFPEDKIPFVEGTQYYIYHIHGEAVDVTGPYNYESGSIAAEFDSLSYVGITENDIALDIINADDTVTENIYYDVADEISATIQNNTVNIYEGFQYGDYGVQVEGVVDYPIMLSQKITYESGVVIYRFYYDGDNTNFDETSISYPFICAEDVTIGMDADTPTEEEITEAYESLMGAATVEEYDSLKETISEDILNQFTEEQNSTLDAYHNTLIESALEAVYDCLMETVSKEGYDEEQEEYKELLAKYSFTETQQTMLDIHYGLIPYRADIIYTPFSGQVGPLMPPVSLVSTYARMTSYGLNTASEETEVESVDNPALVTSKNVADNGDGTYTVTLEAYATGTVSVTTQKTAVDVVLVLDMSSSMKEDFGDNGDSRFDAVKNAAINFVGEINKDAKGDDGEYGTDDDTDHRVSIVTYYTEGNVECGLKNMATESGYTEAAAAAAGLAMHSKTRADLGLATAIEVFDADTEDNGIDNDTYTNTTRQRVVVFFTDGYPTESGSSHFDTEYAKDAINHANTLKLSTDQGGYGATIYSVAVLDQASPTGTVTWEGEGGEGVAIGLVNAYLHAISSNYPDATARLSTDSEVSVYAPSRPDEGEGDKPGGGGTTTELIITPGIGSNNNYYLTAEDPDDLNAIFNTVSNTVQSGSTSVDLGTESVVKDIVTPYFTIPDGTSGVTVTTVDCESYDESTGVATWDETSSQSLDNSIISIVNNTLDVSGFDFTKNYVAENGRVEGDSTQEGSFHGRKLVITFDIEPTEYFLGGDDVDTNGAASGIYDKDGNLIETFTLPNVDITVKTICPVTQNQYIYATNTGSIQELITQYYVKQFGDAVDINRIVDGINNAYVDLIYTIKDSSGTVVGTFTVPRGSTFYNAYNLVSSWVLASGQTWTPALSEDETYTISCKVYASENNQSTGDGTATIYVFNPVLAFKDSVGFLGGTAPEINDSNNLVAASTIWENATQGYVVTGSTTIVKNEDGTATSTGNTMSGTEPELNITYEVGAGVTEGIITTTSDIPVDVTSVTRADNTSVTVSASCEHQNCNGKNCTLPDGAELVIHVYSPTLTLKDSNVYYGGTVPTDYSKNVVDVTWSNATLGETEGPVLSVSRATELTVVDQIEDIPVTVTVTRQDNNRNITAGTTIIHADCISDEAEGEADILLHVYVPSYTFADTYVHYGAEIPTNQTVLDNTTTSNGWVKADPDGASADNYANEQPTLTVSYEPNETGMIEDTDDIGVNVTVLAGGLDATGVTEFNHTNCADITDALGNSKFLLHVCTPVFTFKDSIEDYASTLTNVGSAYYEANNKITTVSWENISGTIVSDFMTEEPTFTFTYYPEKDWYDANKIVTSPTDIYVNVEVKLGDTPVGEGCFEFEHAACGVTGCAFEASKGEFIVHINKKYTSLTITKNIIDETGMHDLDQTFIFDVTGTDFSGKAISMKVVLKAGESAVINNLLVDSECTVTEDTKWSWRYTADDEEQLVKLDAVDAKNVVTFTNTLVNKKWLDSNCYEDNEFAAVYSVTTSVE